ncbi:hypothetical protein FS837_006156 [Tulasnella sp. UAMH 9824]|nr:hypothetical protein FS837_006156 [Tulasnella sp. UAMH 9824]
MPYSSPNGSAFLEDLPSQVISSPSKADDLKYDDVVEKLEMTQEETKHYRLYRRRFVGATALCLLNCLGGMSGMWFSAISIDTADAFHVSVSKVNWLSNITNVVFILSSFTVPSVVGKWGIRPSCIFAAGILVVACWLRFAGTAHSLNSNGAYALLLVSQLLTGVAQPFYQALAPRYSEAWFGLRGRVTATMVMSLMNPVGNAIGQLLAPVGTVRLSILVLAIITTAIAPVAFALGERPPTPPTLSGSKVSPSILDTLRRMSRRELCDFAILVWGFGVLVGVINSFTTLVAQIYAPYGYDSNQSGFLVRVSSAITLFLKLTILFTSPASQQGAALLIAGIVGAVITAPFFDRVLAYRLAQTVQIIVPILGACWLGFIWAVQSNGLAASYSVLVIIGFCCFTLLPVSLELGCEITRNAEFSGAILWLSANALSLFFVLISTPLKASPSANPPSNLRNQLILHAAGALSITPMALFLKGRQVRREMDEKENTRDSAGQEGHITEA